MNILEVLEFLFQFFKVSITSMVSQKELFSLPQYLTRNEASLVLIYTSVLSIFLWKCYILWNLSLTYFDFFSLSILIYCLVYCGYGSKLSYSGGTIIWNFFGLISQSFASDLWVKHLFLIWRLMSVFIFWLKSFLSDLWVGTMSVIW